MMRLPITLARNEQNLKPSPKKTYDVYSTDRLSRLGQKSRAYLLRFFLNIMTGNTKVVEMSEI
jgi:hypothetical protein